MLQGMVLFFYDVLIGQGIECIENKDIVVLMQYFMVCDVQCSVCDMEIVVLLMNVVLDMCNSFWEMKDFIQEMGDDMIFVNVENIEKFQKVINGFCFIYIGGLWFMQSVLLYVIIFDDLNVQKKNLWKCVLVGLGVKGSNDFGCIEDMLMQLFGEVDVFKIQIVFVVGLNQSVCGLLGDFLQFEGYYEVDKGYEFEGVLIVSYVS